MTNWTLSKLKTVLQKTLLQKWRGKPQTEGKCLQYMYLTNDLCLEYTEYAYNLIIRSWATQLKMEKRFEDLTEKDIQKANKHMKKCTASLIIIGMQIKP